MQVIHQDFKKGEVRLRITDTEDLWHLRSLIDPHDIVTGITSRKVSISATDSGKVSKRTFLATIDAEMTELTEQELRINGKITAAPEDIPRGNYQSISLEVGSECTIQKESWPRYLQQKLKDACQEKRRYLLCLLERDEALLAITTPSGHKVVARLQGEVQKKQHSQTLKQDFYEEVRKTLEEVALREKPAAIIIASPAFYKDELAKKITDPSLKKNITLAICSDISESAISEVLKRPELKSLLHDSRLREEQLLVEELLREINKQALAVYGLKEVQKAVQAGAVAKLLVTDDYIRQAREQDTFQTLDRLMELVEQAQGEMIIISIEHDGGKALRGLGGIAAILRYKLASAVD